MNKSLAAVLIASVLSATSAFAEDRYRTSVEDGKQRIDFSLNGNDRCVIVDDKVTCQPARKTAARVAATETN